MHQAGLLEVLPLHHVFERGARALDIGQQVVELQPLLRLGRIELEGEFGRGQREQLQHAGVEQDVLRRKHGRRSHRADHGEDLVALDHLLRRQHRALRIVAVVLEDQLELAAVDAAGRVDFLDRHFHAVGDRHAPDLDRTGQILMGADHDLGRRDAFIGDLGLRGSRQIRSARAPPPQGPAPLTISTCQSPLRWPVLMRRVRPFQSLAVFVIYARYATALSPYMASISLA